MIKISGFSICKEKKDFPMSFKYNIRAHDRLINKKSCVLFSNKYKQNYHHDIPGKIEASHNFIDILLSLEQMDLW